jgi:hypothetical protein
MPSKRHFHACRAAFGSNNSRVRYAILRSELFYFVALNCANTILDGVHDNWNRRLALQFDQYHLYLRKCLLTG